MAGDLSVGEVAARSGVAVSALHFYERRGLIQSHRTGGNQRRFDRQVLRRLAMIRVGQELGIPLAEIGEQLARIAGGTGAGQGRLGEAVAQLARQARPPHRPADAAARRVDRLHRMRLPVAQVLSAL